MVQKIYKEHTDMGYRRIRDDLVKKYDINVNDKRVYRITQFLHIKSTVKHRPNGCTKHVSSPAQIAENSLNRNFKAERPNEKWLTDVTEFKYYVGPEIRKLYLSAILDLYGNHIISWKISDRNDNALVYGNFDDAVAAQPNAHPLFHSDRGYQYTSPVFHHKLIKANMKQSMSRVGRCIDNGPMEGFWGILKREMYFGHRFTSRDELIKAINDYMHYYNENRLQRGLNIMTPLEYCNAYNNVA